jgi:hypothetical protein
MSLFILTETSAGYALLKSKDKKLFKRESLPEDANTAEGISNLYVQLLLWQKKTALVGKQSTQRSLRKFFWLQSTAVLTFLRVASS